MIKAVYKLRELLAESRAGIEHELSDKRAPTVVAALDMVDELDRRLGAITDKVPIDAPVTKTIIMHDAERWIDTVQLVRAAMSEMSRLVGECGDIVYQRWHPLTAVINRVESENYDVSAEDFTTVTDAKDWTVLDTITAPEVRVQLEAEKIARAEQAKAYQQRLERMKAAIQVIENQYADRIRQLPYTTPIPPMPDVPPQKVLRTLPSGELVFDYEPTDTPPQT
ncbi:hypothetical protein [Mycobacteroides abscessus]|uniref:hypothetical protein n=1 Tax=Mycobacteroides abscessus TaxID=36809 RepID=UPI0011C3C2EA|nr:hypothetical protein [Mycobacteroides abscessus]